MDNDLTIAIIQMVSGSSWEKNLAIAARLIEEAGTQGAKLVILPEFFIRIADTKDQEFFDIIEPLGVGRIQERLSQLARENNIYLVAGTIPIRTLEETKCYNTAIVYAPDGNMLCYYHKIHLFKFDNGEHRFDEGATFQCGTEVVTFSIGNFTFGLTICYDLRFPELFRKMAGVDAVILPAAFIHHTGKDHWEVLLRARAIENQCYVIAASQGGIHDSGRHTFGHSMLINPWGAITSIIKDGEGLIMGKLEKQIIKQIRTQLPALEHRRV